MLVDLPEKLATALERIDWSRVTDKDLNVLVKIGIPFLEIKGYLKNNKGDTQNGKFS
jgi:hypothetical protein